MIQVTDRFYINANSNCYALQEKNKVQDENSKNYGQEIFKDIGYYTSLEGCIKGILKISTREYISKDCVNTLKELEEVIKNTNEELERRFNKLWKHADIV